MRPLFLFDEWSKVNHLVWGMLYSKFKKGSKKYQKHHFSVIDKKAFFNAKGKSVFNRLQIFDWLALWLDRQ